MQGSMESSSKKVINSFTMIAKDITDIIKYSCNDDFRRACMRVCQVSSTNECQERIQKQLEELSLKSTTSGKRPRKISKRDHTNIKRNNQQTIQEGFEKQEALQEANCNRPASMETEGTLLLLDSESKKKKTDLRQQTLTKMFKKVKAVSSSKQDAAKSHANEVIGQEADMGPKFIEGEGKKPDADIEFILLDPKNFKWDDDDDDEDNENGVTNTTIVSSVTQSKISDDVLSILTDPKTFTWDDNEE